MTQVTNNKPDTRTTAFPFLVDDIDYWVMRRKNGETIRYRLDDGARDRPRLVATSSPVTQAGGSTNYYTSLSRYCNHYPSAPPVFEADGVELRIADAAGTRRDWDQSDLLLDCGAILSGYEMEGSQALSGDSELVGLLYEYGEVKPKCRVLKIKWADREAPPLPPQFWPALLEEIKALKLKKILTACQGGHGRSGTSLVCLMMALSDYSALDAITHLRAIHCARAIESVVQHEYINRVAEHLGRKTDAAGAKDVKDYEARFLAMTSPFAASTQERLRNLKS